MCQIFESNCILTLYSFFNTQASSGLSERMNEKLEAISRWQDSTGDTLRELGRSVQTIPQDVSWKFDILLSPSYSNFLYFIVKVVVAACIDHSLRLVFCPGFLTSHTDFCKLYSISIARWVSSVLILVYT